MYMTTNNDAFRLFLLLFLFVCGSILSGQGVQVEDHALYRSVLPTILNNQPDSFRIKMAEYFGSPEDSLAARVLIEKALHRGVQTGSKLWELEAYHGFSIYYSKGGDKKTALRYACKAESLLPDGTLSQRLQNYNLQGIYYSSLGEPDISASYYTKGITELENTGNKATHARVGTILYFNRSSFYLGRDNFLVALSDCLKALKYAALDEDATQNFQYRLMSRLAKIQRKFGDESNWKASLQKVVALALENRTPYDSAMAMTYQLELAEDVELGEGYFTIGMKIAQKHHLALPLQSTLLHQMGLLYKKNNMSSKQEELNSELLSLYPDSSANVAALTIARLTKGRLQLERGKAKEAIYWAERVIKESQELQDVEMEMNGTSLLSNAYAALNNYESSYRAKVAQNILQDSLTAKINPTSLLETFLKYEYDQDKKVAALKVAQEKASLEAQMDHQQILITSGILGFISLSCLMLLLLNNIRNKRRSEKSLLQQRQLLLSSNERLNLFSGIVSHDILSNLDLIIARGNVLVDGDYTKEQLRAYYENTQRAARKLKQYCINLLDMSRVSSSPSFTSGEEIEAIISALLQHYAPELTTLQVMVQIDRIPDLPIPLTAIEEFLHNGITNVLKYVPQVDKIPSLRIYGQSSPNEVGFLCIEDNGPGISPAALEAFFHDQPTGATKDRGGIGLINLKKNLRTMNLVLAPENKAEGGLRLKIFGVKQTDS